MVPDGRTEGRTDAWTTPKLYPSDFVGGITKTIHKRSTALESIYLRNLLTHTVNNLLQMHNNVKSSQFLVVKAAYSVTMNIFRKFLFSF